MIEKYGLLKNGGQLINKINSIAPSNSIYRSALNFGNKLLEEIGL